MHSILPNLSFIGAHNCPQIDKPPLQNSLNYGGEEKCAEYSSQLLLCNKQAYKKSQWPMTRSLYLAPASAGQLHASVAQLEFECCKWGMAEPLLSVLGSSTSPCKAAGLIQQPTQGMSLSCKWHVFIMAVAHVQEGRHHCSCQLCVPSAKSPLAKASLIADREVKRWGSTFTYAYTGDPAKSPGKGCGDSEG